MTVTEPTIAYRVWRVADGRLRSMAPMLAVTWGPGEDMHAQCRLWGHVISRHAAPDPSCQCGFYVMHSLDGLLEEPTQVAAVRREALWPGGTVPVVAGEVEVWGRSERYSYGRRVEWCRVHALYAEPLAGEVDVGALAERYGVPLVDDGGKIAAWKEQGPEPGPAGWSQAGYVIVSGYRRQQQAAYGAWATHQRAFSSAMKDLAEQAGVTANAVKAMEATARAVGDDPDKPVPTRQDYLSIGRRKRKER